MIGADRRDPLEVAGPGEIVAVVGLHNAYTGNTLSASNAPLTLESIRFPDPVIAQAIIPDRTTDETKLADSLAKLVRDDPTLKFKTDPETKQLILSGMGEFALEVSVEKLQRHPRRQGVGRQADGRLPADPFPSRSRSRRKSSSKPVVRVSTPSW